MRVCLAGSFLSKFMKPEALLGFGSSHKKYVEPIAKLKIRWNLTPRKLTSKLQIQPFRFFCRFDLALAWTAYLVFRLVLGGFRFFAKWLLASIDLCCITADMARRLWSGMLLDHRRVNLLPQTTERKFLKRPRKSG